jgi:predicted metal-binding membrane protein
MSRRRDLSGRVYSCGAGVRRDVHRRLGGGGRRCVCAIPATWHVAAGVITIAAGVYELTPIKRHFRERCRECTRSGMVFGLDCVGSSIGLMAMLIVLGVMSVTWMAVIAVVVVAQKLLPAKFMIDVPLALAIIGLGIVILAAPSSVPGLTHITAHMPTM